MDYQVRFCTTADGVRIAYTTIGGGFPLVEVTAWPADFAAYLRHETGRHGRGRLAEDRMLVLADRRGQGQSQREVGEISLETNLLDLEAVIDELELERFDMLGLVMGCAPALAYAAQHLERVRRLGLWGGVPFGAHAPASVTQPLIDLVRVNWPLARRTVASLIFPTGPVEMQRWIASLMRDALSAEVAAKYFELHMSYDVSQLLADIAVPTMAFHRRGDRVVPLHQGREMAAMIKGARFVELDGDVDYPYYESDTWIDAFIDFLDDTAGRRTTRIGIPGLRTVLFTDLVGHTEMMRRLGDERGRAVLREHERITRETLKAYGGAEVKTMGDGFMASFGSVTRAVDCAIALQRAFAERAASMPEPLQVRVGLNAGEPIEEDGDLFGSTVIMAARIAAQAGRGEILIPEPLRHLLAGKSYVYADRGETTLKGFEDSVHLHEIRWRDS